MKFLSVCSGIEAASVAWKPLGWEASGFAEIEPFPCAVLAHHYPDVPNHGDMMLLPNKIRNGEVEAPDLLCGGTPCQAFSVAGLRQSLDDARGNLTLTFCEIADAIDSKREQSCIVFWENVPGVLNTKDNAFGCFLGALAGEDDALIAPGGRWANAGFIDGPQRAVAWRVLDAQYFGVAQRRRRVFVVASARADFDPAAVLFEFEGVRRNTAPSRETGQKVAGTFTARVNSGGWGSDVDLAASEYMQPYQVANCLTQRMHKGMNSDCNEGQTPVLAPIAFDTTQITSPANYSNPKEGDPCHPLAAGAHVPAIVQPVNIYGGNKRKDRPEGGFYVRMDEDTSKTLDAASGLNPTCSQGGTAVMQSMAVRRLTPVECERLQGFPDNYTNIPWRKQPTAPDGSRYKALGNSWAVPVVKWIGERIERSLA
jgi:DNA (cytosine-5)-methyltransferase 1